MRILITGDPQGGLAEDLARTLTFCTGQHYIGMGAVASDQWLWDVYCHERIRKYQDVGDADVVVTTYPGWSPVTVWWKPDLVVWTGPNRPNMLGVHCIVHGHVQASMMDTLAIHLLRSVC